MTPATRWLTWGRALSTIARSRRTCSLKSINRPSSSVTGCELGRSESEPRRVAKKPGTLSHSLFRGSRRVRVDIDQPAVDLAIGRPAMDRRDRLLERAIVEHGAVEEGGRGRVDAGTQMVREAAGHEAGSPRPAGAALRQHLVHLHDPGRRKGARKRRGGTRGKSETGGIIEIEIALDLAARAAAVDEMQRRDGDRARKSAAGRESGSAAR